MNSIDDEVRVSRRIYIPSKNLRGFEPGKIGPKDGVEYVGGNFGSALNLNSTIPNAINGFENIDFNLFFDAATLREVDYDSSLESDNILLCCDLLNHHRFCETVLKTNLKTVSTI